ncbi:fungal-specific transcription factor domain-containing protein [Glomus cerebriforme]|uniref:Fungal-specific transcription factor domain-containing protein n=1 Tax=Glomus cerebriforme TaxID=658196 RepID=A0A397TJD4_9GLOM|nr:fungal-specific transcription factor domain-containing protein [Glomus cerebriforme]
MSTSMNPSGGKRLASTDTPTRDKRLKTIACDRCRRRKVKCDGDGYNQIPCKYCVSVNLDCTYGQKTARTSGSNNQSSSKANSTSSKNSRSKNTSIVTDNAAVTSSTSTASTNRQRKSSSHAISHQNIKQTTKKSPSISTSNFSTNKRIILQDLPDPDNKKNDIEYIIKLYTSITMQNEYQVRQQLKHYVQIPQVEESSFPHPQIKTSLLEDTHLTGQLVDLYFKNFHPLLPVLHKAYFMERFLDKNKLMSPLLLCAVCAIGSSYTNNNHAVKKDSNNQYTVGMAFYKYGQDMVKNYFDLPSLSTATGLFLLGIFDALRSIRSRMYVGMATTLAVTMRYHEKNAFSETLSINEREARKRLWWGIAIANQLQCITLNRMLALQDNHCNIGYPDESCGYVDENEFKIIEYFKSYLTITKIIYDVLEFNLSENCGFDMNSLEDRLNTWKLQLPSYLNIEEAKCLDTTYNETTIEHLRIYLCILYNYALIRIHHPNISSQLSLATCTRAANNITSLMNENFVNMINSKQFIINCALYAGFIHIFNLKDQQHFKESKRNIAMTIKFFQNILNIPSLHHIHYSIKSSIALFASQLKGIPDLEDYIMDIVTSAFIVITGNVGNNSSSNESPVSPTQLSNSNEESRNINNNNNITSL